MSLLTRCPACTTLYRVVPDQLRISEGWVKCGQCGDIFDASQHLIEATIDPDPPSRAEVDAPSTEDFQPSHDVENDVLLQTDVDVFEADLSQQSLLAQSPDSAAELNFGVEIPEQANIAEVMPSEVQADASANLEVQTAEPDPFAEHLPLPEHALELEPHPEPMQVRWDDATQKDSATNGLSDDSLPSPAQFTFLQTDRGHAFWRKPMVRGTLFFISFALGLSLLGQWVYLERDRLAAQQPDLRPMLLAFCGFAKCDIQPLQRIEALKVDAVGFHQIGKETYRLTFTVKNASTLSLAFPAVELALTDAQDLPVYRRVFSSRDLGAVGGEIAAGADWSAAVSLRMNSTALAPRVLGYRMLVFYP